MAVLLGHNVVSTEELEAAKLANDAEIALLKKSIRKQKYFSSALLGAILVIVFYIHQL